MKKTIGIIVAIFAESKHYFSQLGLRKELKGKRLFYSGEHSGQDIVLIHSHTGPVNAASAAESMILHYSPDLIINSGSAGSHEESILPGDVVIGTRYTSNYSLTDVNKGIIKKKQFSLIRFYSRLREIRLDHIHAEQNLLRMAETVSLKGVTGLTQVSLRSHGARNAGGRPSRIHFGAIGSEDAWTIDRAAIESKRKKFNHIAEDKESTYIAQICLLHDTPFLSIRGISDNELISPTASTENTKRLIGAAAENAARFVLALLPEFERQFRP